MIPATACRRSIPLAIVLTSAAVIFLQQVGFRPHAMYKEHPAEGGHQSGHAPIRACTNCNVIPSGASIVPSAQQIVEPGINQSGHALIRACTNCSGILSGASIASGTTDHREMDVGNAQEKKLVSVPMSKTARSLIAQFCKVLNVSAPALAGVDRLTLPVSEERKPTNPLEECIVLANHVSVPDEIRSALDSAVKNLMYNVVGEWIINETPATACYQQVIATALQLLRAPQAGIVVEYGTFMGYSTRCIAAGVRMANMMAPGSSFRSHAFDSFTYRPKDKFKSKLWGSVAKPEAYMHKVRQNVLPFTVKLTPGWIGTHSGNVGSGKDWGNNAVSAFFVDASKSKSFFLEQMSLMEPWVRPGSMIVLGDSLMENAICHQIGELLGALVHPGYLRLSHISCCSSHSWWEVLKDVPAGTFKNFRFSSLDKKQWQTLWESFFNGVRAGLEQSFSPDRVSHIILTHQRKVRNTCSHLHCAACEGKVL